MLRFSTGIAVLGSVLLRTSFASLHSVCRKNFPSFLESFQKQLKTENFQFCRSVYIMKPDYPLARRDESIVDDFHGTKVNNVKSSKFSKFFLKFSDFSFLK